MSEQRKSGGKENVGGPNERGELRKKRVEWELGEERRREDERKGGEMGTVEQEKEQRKHQRRDLHTLCSERNFCSQTTEYFHSLLITASFAVTNVVPSGARA